MMSWDLHLLQRINQEWTHAFLDWLMPAASCLHAWLPLLLLLALVIAWRGGRPGRRMLLGIALAICLGDGLVSNGLKKTVGRVRPHNAITGVVTRDLAKGRPEFTRLFKTPVQYIGTPNGETHGKSFPSSHTLNLFAVAVVVSAAHRGFGALGFALAALVGYSRVYVGSHWPTDVISSVGLGLLVGLASVWLVQRCGDWRAARRSHPPA